MSALRASIFLFAMLTPTSRSGLFNDGASRLTNPAHPYPNHLVRE